MIYTHVLNNGGRGIRSPLDQLGNEAVNLSRPSWTDRPGQPISAPSVRNFPPDSVDNPTLRER